MTSEIPFKEWVYTVAEREKVSARAIYMRLSRGQMPRPTVRVVNARGDLGSGRTTA